MCVDLRDRIERPWRDNLVGFVVVVWEDDSLEPYNLSVSAALAATWDGGLIATPGEWY
jgi:hypothetical protein